MGLMLIIVLDKRNTQQIGIESTTISFYYMRSDEVFATVNLYCNLCTVPFEIQLKLNEYLESEVESEVDHSQHKKSVLIPWK